MKDPKRRPDTASTRRTLALPRWFVLLLSVTIWPLLILLFHGVLPWVVSGMARRFGWAERHPGWWNWPGLVFVGLGAIVVLWFWFVHVRKVAVPQAVELGWNPRHLLTDGPYRYSRNPMYLAVLMIWFGWAVVYGSLLVLAGSFFGWLLLNFVVIPREERGLEARHGEHYRSYVKRVPRWF
jgi:protein-S-isoprenylcysteine O-methyltransferase Ste14